MLVRQYLGQRLASYYAQPSRKVVGSISTDGISFSSLWGEWHWRREYRRLYQQQEGQWLTPVELFRPYFSNVLANFVYETCDTEEAVEIVELGGGRGTNANLVLSHLQQTRPEFYERIHSYTIIDSSPSLFELQQETLLNGHHAGKVRFSQKDLLDVAEEK